jgi:hypothetical protein
MTALVHILQEFLVQSHNILKIPIGKAPSSKDGIVLFTMVRSRLMKTIEEFY